MPQAEPTPATLDYAHPPRVRRRGVPWLRNTGLIGSFAMLTGQLAGIAMYAVDVLRDLQLLLTWGSTYGGAVALLLAVIALAFNPRGLREIAAVGCGVANGACFLAASVYWA
jgi:hypothetical protein